MPHELASCRWGADHTPLSAAGQLKHCATGPMEQNKAITRTHHCWTTEAGAAECCQHLLTMEGPHHHHKQQQAKGSQGLQLEALQRRARSSTTGRPSTDPIWQLRHSQHRHSGCLKVPLYSGRAWMMSFRRRPA